MAMVIMRPVNVLVDGVTVDAVNSSVPLPVNVLVDGVMLAAIGDGASAEGDTVDDEGVTVESVGVTVESVGVMVFAGKLAEGDTVDDEGVTVESVGVMVFDKVLANATPTMRVTDKRMDRRCSLLKMLWARIMNPLY